MMMRRRIWQAMRVGIAAAAIVSGLAATAAAQETTGTLTGAAKDQTGAVLPGVTVTVKFVQTGASQEFVTNENGLYTADFNPVLRRSHQRLAVGLGPAPFQAK